MSQILRLSSHLFNALLFENVSTCRSCMLLRSGQIRNSSNSKALEEQPYIFTPRAKKRHEQKSCPEDRINTSHFQLYNTLTARVNQLSDKGQTRKTETFKRNKDKSSIDCDKISHEQKTEKTQPSRNKSDHRLSDHRQNSWKSSETNKSKFQDKFKGAVSKSTELSAEALEKRQKKRLKYLAKKTKLKKALDEYYTRKSPNHKQRDNDETVKYLGVIHKQGKGLSELFLPSKRINRDAKQSFAFDRTSAQTEGDILFDFLSGKSGIEPEETEAATEVSNDLLPDEEWEVLKQLRHHYKSSLGKPKWSEEEWLDYERKLDVFYEEETPEPYGDLTSMEGLILPVDLEMNSLEGVVTKKAKKKREKTNRLNKKTANSSAISLSVRSEVNNDSLLDYADACSSCGLTRTALELTELHRRTAEGITIEDVRIYNCLLRGLLHEGAKFSELQRLYGLLKEDGLQPTMETYMLCLAGIKDTSEHGILMASFIIKSMIMQGLDVKDIFNQCEFVQNERHAVYQMLKAVMPDYEPNLPTFHEEYEGPLLDGLNTSLSASEKVDINPFAGVFTSDEVRQRAERQFNIELDGNISMKSIFNTKKKMDVFRENEIKILEKQWQSSIQEMFVKKRQDQVQLLASKNVKTVTLLPFLCVLPTEDYVNIMVKEALRWTVMSQAFSATCSRMAIALGQQVEQRYRIQTFLDAGVFPKLSKAYCEYVELYCDPDSDPGNQRLEWSKIMHRLSDGNSMCPSRPEWSEATLKMVGVALFNIILDGCHINTNHFSKNTPAKYVKAFRKIQRTRQDQLKTEVMGHPVLSRLMNAESDISLKPWEVPSLCPVVPYTSSHQGGNFTSSLQLCTWGDEQKKKFEEQQPKPGAFIDNLNILGSTPWKINKPMLEVVMKIFKSGGDPSIDIPQLPDNLPTPDKLDKSKLEGQDEKTIKRMNYEYNKEKQMFTKVYSETNSLWWSCLYKLSIANKFKDEVMWFPMKVDFRGRVYPYPPHLNHQGQDFVRCLLVFAKGKPLGSSGLDWLKLHLMNLSGLLKRASYKEKLAHVETLMPEILDSAQDPLGGNGWWKTLDDPFQCLSTCMEIANAVNSGDPSQFISYLPIHQDGSCNGLQHYAALGRDNEGARSVNLHPLEQPADVYSDIVHLVMEELESDMNSDLPTAKLAAMCRDYLDRKVIKQTIMTTVYGVTTHGASLQIARQLGYKEFPEKELRNAARYLMNKTFLCLKKLFFSAKDIQKWFDLCSLTICRKTNKPVEWVTPLYFPVLQCYYKTQRTTVKGRMLEIRESQYLKVDSQRQKNGFAPNFIHSLDATHMALTALYCHRKGITFSAVHDCFWTHASSVDVMNVITREQFVALHNQPILDNLSKHFLDTYIHNGDLSGKDREILAAILSKVPHRGTFDLNNVMHSTYFFS
ncbi:DNA-directed RNA polymerase, mitochondrial-like [Mya arenaria]|uniref:DNA-directed RNA polymerase, mitochondrial-like n=1 Tax=Mya arenaria TaxID=6604 RepID=UPI0022E55455|nr:DNA-directed RNA polymerase, mitochondrial-like [Mya arenaria]